MKLTKLAKSVLAASALTVASFGANASAIATSTVDIQDLFFSFLLDDGESVDASVVSFSGTNTSGAINGNGNNTAWTSGSVDLEYLQGSGYDTSLTGVAAKATIDGSIVFDPANFGTDGIPGSDGYTFASASAIGTDSAESNSNVDNTFSAIFDLVSRGDVELSISFSWLIDLYTEITNEKNGQLAKAGYNFTISIGDSSCNAFNPCQTPDFNFDLAADRFGGADELQSDEPFETQAYTSAITAEALTFDMLDGVNYAVKITQKSNANVVSVTEPTTVAILGLGLLGFAGAARRRKS